MTTAETVFEILVRSEAGAQCDRCRFLCGAVLAVLGRLLDIYDQKKTTNSRLTEFVKELLRLDALVDGLDHAFHVTRIRKLAPVHRQLEDARDLLDKQLERERSNVETARQATAQRIVRLNELLAVPDSTAGPVATGFDVAALRARVGDRDRDQAELASVTQQGSEVSSLLSRLDQTSAVSPTPRSRRWSGMLPPSDPSTKCG